MLNRKKLYPLTVLIIYICWLGCMLTANRWHLIPEWWPMSLTMILGSFVAGASAGGITLAFGVNL